jgi:hypothetical protein
VQAVMRVGPGQIRELLPRLDAERFSREVFAQTGIFVVRKAIPPEIVREWQAAWLEFIDEMKTAGGRSVNRFNPVAVDEPPLPYWRTSTSTRLCSTSSSRLSARTSLCTTSASLSRTSTAVLRCSLIRTTVTTWVGLIRPPRSWRCLP